MLIYIWQKLKDTLKSHLLLAIVFNRVINTGRKDLLQSTHFTL